MSTTINAAIMSARTVEDKYAAAAETKVPKLLVSADSHVDEPIALWDSLPADQREQLPKLVTWDNSKRAAGGLDPKIRIEHMDLDGVSAEVLYPTITLRAFAAPQKAQEGAFRLYNDWLASYCKTSPKRLFGIPCLSVYDIDAAVKEMQRCHDMGLRGGLIWQVPEPSLPFKSMHYEKLWAAASELGYPINFHILSGFSYNRFMGQVQGMEVVRGSVNIKTADAVTTVFDLVWSGVFERHPKLKLQMVESEIGWLPFVLQQWDYYFQRFTKPGQAAMQKFEIARKPSEIFKEHFYATFMDDDVGAHMLKIWGEKNCMWSSDYPHGNMTWPNSRAFLAKQMADMDPARIKRLTSQNVIDLYKLEL
ncbi:MAG TPA: amidohydrolase family protein [Alphaproteobacteria bacterium]|jgi:predicted TIM-barrel fold metal-dependent hydrolase